MENEIMAAKRDKKALEKQIKGMSIRIKTLKNGNLKLKKENEELSKIVKEQVKGRAASEPEDIRIGCKDCGMVGTITKSESKALSKITCPRCGGNIWKMLT